MRNLRILKSKLNKLGFVDVNHALSFDTDWIVQIGGRTGGKTYGWLEKILEAWWQEDRPSVLCRRLKDTFEDGAYNDVWAELLDNGWRKKLGCDVIVKKKMAFYCGYKDSAGKVVLDDKPFCYCVALSTIENKKSTFPDIKMKYFLYDEFLTRDGYYLKDEFILLANAISTCKRKVSDAKIIMSANTVSWGCPYFREFGLYEVQKMKQGDIQIYEFTDGIRKTTMLVEYTLASNYKGKKESDRYFAFNNPRLKMITDGDWEIPMYRRLIDVEYRDTTLINRNVYFNYGNDFCCAEFRTGEKIGDFVYIRPYQVSKKKPIDDRFVRVYTDGIFSDDDRYRNNIGNDNIDKIIRTLYKKNKFYYADNTCGELIRNVLVYMGEKI